MPSALSNRDPGLSTSAATTSFYCCRGPLVNFRSPSEYVPDGAVAALGAAPPLQGFRPFSASRTSGSDSSRGYQTRVRCVFRVSHPLDAFFLPKPPSRISDRNAHGVPALRRFPLPRLGPCLPAVPARLALARADAQLFFAVRNPRPPSGLPSPRKSVVPLPTSGSGDPILP